MAIDNEATRAAGDIRATQNQENASKYQVADARLLYEVGQYLAENYVGEELIIRERCAATSFGETPQSFFEEPIITGSFDALSLEQAMPPELAERLDQLDESFAKTVLRLIDERGLSDVEVYKRANMSRQLFAKIRKDDNYRPTKRTACALAFAIGLDHDDALALLDRAGFTLSHSSKFDVIIEYFLVNQVYDIYEINSVLYAFDQQLLG